MNSCLRASDTVRRFAGSRMKIFSSKSAKCFNCTTNTTDARVRAHTHTYGQTTQTDTKDKTNTKTSTIGGDTTQLYHKNSQTKPRMIQSRHARPNPRDTLD
jgi:hypothetical protein